MPAPEVHLNESERRLIRLLAELLTDAWAMSDGNRAWDVALLNDSQADELVELMENYLGGGAFLASASFIDALSQEDLGDGFDIYEIERMKKGRKAANQFYHWEELKRRLGLEARAFYHYSCVPMTRAQFEKKERDLLIAVGVRPYIADLAIRVLRNKIPEWEGEPCIPVDFDVGQVRQTFSDAFSRSSLREGTISQQKLVGAVALLADFSTMFTTRDWTVTGTISGIAAFATMAADK